MMVVKTRIFGEIVIEESKIITFVNGIVGFPELTQFALIYDEEKGKTAGVRWLQSVQEAEFAIPVIDPLMVMEDFNPEVDDELLRPIGELNPDEMLVLVTITVPSDLKQMTVNLKAPIIINAKECKACQIIAEGEKYQVKYPIYEILQANKKAGE